MCRGVNPLCKYRSHSNVTDLIKPGLAIELLLPHFQQTNYRYIGLKIYIKYQKGLIDKAMKMKARYKIALFQNITIDL